MENSNNLNPDNKNQNSVPQQNDLPNNDTNEPTPRHSDPEPTLQPLSPEPVEGPESQNKIPKPVRDDSTDEPEDMLAGTDDVQGIPTENVENNQPQTAPPVEPTADIPAQQSKPEATPTVPPATDSVIPTPSSVIPSSTGNPEKNSNNNIAKPLAGQAKSKKLWMWISIVVLLAIIIGATTYMDLWPSWLKSPISSIIKVEPQESFVPLFSRSSTLPSGIFSVNGNQLSVSINNLEFAKDRQFNYKVMLTGSGSNLELGIFDGSDEEGQLINFDGSRVSFVSVNNIENYDTVSVQVVSRSAGNKSSTILNGNLIKAENNPSVMAELSFPHRFDDAFTGVELSEVRGGENTIKFDATNLPNLSDIEYEYELRLVEFIGPNVNDELVLGRFQGDSFGATNFVSKTSKSLNNFTQVVISVEPIWDNDSSISQIKPFAGEM